jgi:hypothetical protein
MAGQTHVTARPAGSRDARFEALAPPYAYMLREVTRCGQQGLVESPTMPVADTLTTMRLFDEARGQLGVRYPNDVRWDCEPRRGGVTPDA